MEAAAVATIAGTEYCKSNLPNFSTPKLLVDSFNICNIKPITFAIRI